MTTAILRRILHQNNADNLLEILADSLTPSDLQSLLLEVYRKRTARQTPSGLLELYEHNRFVRPSSLNPQALLEFDRLAFSLAAPKFEPIEIAPVCPLGSASIIATVDQNNALATTRNTEVVSDSTNVLALECALRRRVLLRSQPQDGSRVSLCASHRLLRPQKSDHPNALAHFRLFALCSAGRDEGGDRFETESLREHIAFYLNLLSAWSAEGFAGQNVRVAVTDFVGTRLDRLQSEVVSILAAKFPDVHFGFDPDRVTGRGYYDRLCFHIYATGRDGTEHLLADGGITTWTQQLLSSKKERLLISGIGTERLCSLFGRS